MAPELISLSSILAFHPFGLSHRLMNPTPAFLSLNSPKPSYIIVCESAASQTRPNRKLYSSRTHKKSETGPDGSGAASPTRGEIFLDRQQSMEASATVIAATKKKKKKKDKVLKASSSLLPGCYGCGAPLQTSETDAPGYVDPDTYYLKKKHRQLRTALCRRCRLLCHGHMITAVGGNGGYSGGMQFVYAEELREKLAHLCLEKALIVKLVDIVDFNGSFLAHIRDIVGANPIILVVTKIDLLPRGTDLNCVGDWVVEATLKKKLNVISVHLTSSKSLVGITGVVSEIQKEKKGRDVYILGSANVGKSAFINAFLKIMSYKDPVAAAARKYKPIQSAVPGTTLGPIQIDAFLGGGKLFDTPGVHLHHRQAAVVHAEDLPALAPKSRLRGQTLPSYQVASETLMADQLRSRGLNAFTIFWGGLVRIDLVQVLPETSLTFYGPKALKIHTVPTEEADEFYKKEVGGLLTPPTGREKANDWMGLETVRNLEIRYDNIQRPASDVAISGLGWICVEAVNKKFVGTYNLEKKPSSDDVLLMNVFVPKPVEVFVRPPIPVGKDGGEWYEFRELSEKEEEVRPKWHF